MFENDRSITEKEFNIQIFALTKVPFQTTCNQSSMFLSDCEEYTSIASFCSGSFGKYAVKGSKSLKIFRSHVRETLLHKLERSLIILTHLRICRPQFKNFG